MKRFRGGLVFKAHRYHSPLGSRVIKKKKKKGFGVGGYATHWRERDISKHLVTGTKLRIFGYRSIGESVPDVITTLCARESVSERGRERESERESESEGLRTTTSQKCAVVPRRARI